MSEYTAFTLAIILAVVIFGLFMVAFALNLIAWYHTIFVGVT